MGYGFKAYVDAVLILTRIKGRKAMANKADEVRKLLIEGATTPRIVLAIMRRCKVQCSKLDADGGKPDWICASIAQTANVLDLPMVHARALVSEYAPTTLSGDWKKILDNLDI